MMKFVFLCTVVLLCASHVTNSEESAEELRSFLFNREIDNRIFSNLNRDKRSPKGSHEQKHSKENSHEKHSHSQEHSASNDNSGESQESNGSKENSHSGEGEPSTTHEHRSSEENSKESKENSLSGELKPSSSHEHSTSEQENSKESKEVKITSGPTNATKTSTTTQTPRVEITKPTPTQPSAPISVPNKNNTSQRCIQNSITPVSCSGHLDEDGLLPHPDDCQLFYQCVSNELPPVCKECPANLHFNPAKKVCDYPDTAGCQTTQEGKIESNQCKEHNGVFADLFPHPTACDRYYVCDWGRAILMYCPEGLHFNPTLLICDYPAHAGCQANENIPA